MNQLNSLRSEIDQIDHEIADLLLKRLQVVEKIQHLKPSLALGARDAQREKHVVSVYASHLGSHSNQVRIESFVHQMICLNPRL